MTKPSPSDDTSKPLDFNAYVPFLVMSVANGLSRGARYYSDTFGVGVTEWRIISVMFGRDEITANQICEAAALDRGATSRSLALLKEQGYVVTASHERDARKRALSLTKAGIALYKQMLKVALEREQHLLKGFGNADKETLIRLLNRLRDNLSKGS